MHGFFFLSLSLSPSLSSSLYRVEPSKKGSIALPNEKDKGNACVFRDAFDEAQFGDILRFSEFSRDVGDYYALVLGYYGRENVDLHLIPVGEQDHGFVLPACVGDAPINYYRDVTIGEDEFRSPFSCAFSLFTFLSLPPFAAAPHTQPLAFLHPPPLSRSHPQQLIDPNRLSQKTSRYRDLVKYFEKMPSLDSSDQILAWSRDSNWGSRDESKYKILSYSFVKKTMEEFEVDCGDWNDDVLDDPRRLDWWKDFAVLYDKRKGGRKKRILSFLVKCWGAREGSDVLSVLIEYLVE